MEVRRVGSLLDLTTPPVAPTVHSVGPYQLNRVAAPTFFTAAIDKASAPVSTYKTEGGICATARTEGTS
eukprot:scaffold96205_cov115-Phaeocystis_antarctica.AAC.1